MTGSTTLPTPVRRPWRGVLAEFADRLPVDRSAPVVTLLEGGTPLVPADHLSRVTRCEVLLKVEGANPTGSFKDRGMTVAMTVARHEGAQAVICASTGNTSASAAAYAARAGLTCAVLVPRGKVAAGKLAQAVVHGARLVAVDGGFDACLRLARELADAYPVSLVNSVNTYRIEGQKTAAFEVVAALGDAPDVHALPVGNAGNITAYWQGYREDADAGRASRRPRMLGVQAAGAAPLATGLPVDAPDTLATAIRIGQPASAAGALAARDESGGAIVAVPDERILAAQQLLAAREGVFVEPASAAAVAGLLTEHASGRLPAGSRVVCTVTGHGLKDPDTALLGAGEAARTPLDVAADVEVVAAALGLR